MFELSKLGWSAERAAALSAYDGCEPARVSEHHKELYKVWTSSGERTARLSGRFRHENPDHEAYPAVGDWVALQSLVSIRAVLPRATAIIRKRVLGVTEAQVIAANIDYVFIVTSLNRDFNPRRLERYLTIVWDSGARPVVILTKSDLCDDVEGHVAEAEALAFGAPVHAICAPEHAGLDALSPYVGPCITVALIGSSGVGKSTLINELMGAEVQAVKHIRKDAYRGQHTTTSRQMVQLPDGGQLIDTPGMREIALWDSPEGFARSFDDIEGFAQRCRFRDCSHRVEPGCAILRALRTGELDEGRWESYSKLKRELAWLDRKQRQRNMLESKRARRRRC